MLMTWNSRKVKYRADNAQELAYVVNYIDSIDIGCYEYWQHDFLKIRKECRKKGLSFKAVRSLLLSWYTVHHNLGTWDHHHEWTPDR